MVVPKSGLIRLEKDSSSLLKNPSSWGCSMIRFEHCVDGVTNARILSRPGRVVFVRVAGEPDSGEPSLKEDPGTGADGT